MFKVEQSNYTTGVSDLSQFVNFNAETGYDPLNSDFLRRLMVLPTAGKVVLTSVDHNRLDLVAYRLYSTTRLWWVLLAYNEVASIEDLKPGDVIAYPSMDDLTTLYNVLVKTSSTPDSSDIAQETNTTEDTADAEFYSNDDLFEWAPNNTDKQQLIFDPRTAILYASISDAENVAYTTTENNSEIRHNDGAHFELFSEIINLDGEVYPTLSYYYFQPASHNLGQSEKTGTITFNYGSTEIVCNLAHYGSQTTPKDESNYSFVCLVKGETASSTKVAIGNNEYPWSCVIRGVAPYDEVKEYLLSAGLIPKNFNATEISSFSVLPTETVPLGGITLTYSAIPINNPGTINTAVTYYKKTDKGTELDFSKAWVTVNRNSAKEDVVQFNPEMDVIGSKNQSIEVYDIKVSAYKSTDEANYEDGKWLMQQISRYLVMSYEDINTPEEIKTQETEAGATTTPEEDFKKEMSEKHFQLTQMVKDVYKGQAKYNRIRLEKIEQVYDKLSEFREKDPFESDKDTFKKLKDSVGYTIESDSITSAALKEMGGEDKTYDYLPEWLANNYEKYLFTKDWYKPVTSAHPKRYAVVKFITKTSNINELYITQGD